MTTKPGAKVLIVDDEPANLLALEAVLEQIGATLVRADSGPEALRQAQDTDFAAILLDVRMPGMDGFEAAHLLRSRPRSRNTPILFVTAWDSEDISVEEAYALGAVDFLTKPVMPAVLKAKVSFFIELHTSREELRAAERRAVNERAFLAAVLESVEDSIVACDPDGVLTLFNRATRALHGLPEEPLSSAQWASHYDLYRGDGKTPMENDEVPLLRALRGEAVHDVEMVVAPKGAPSRSLIANGQALYDSAGRKLGAVVSMHDVTARRDAEAARSKARQEKERRRDAEAAAQANAKFRAFFEQGSYFAGVMTPDGTLLEANRLSLQSGGLSRSDVVGRKLWECGWWGGSPELVETVRTASLQAAAGRIFQQELPYFTTTGKQRSVDLIIAPVTDENGKVLFIAPSGVDTTERNAAAAALRSSEERYRSLFTAMDEGFCIIEMVFDDQGRPVDYRFLEANPAFEKHTGMHDVIGKGMRELVPDLKQHWFDVYGKVARTGIPERFVQHAEPMGRSFDVYATPIGNPVERRLAVLVSDITIKLRAEDDLRRLAAELAASDQRKTEFLATLAHELRNPLAPLRNGLHVMRLAEGDAKTIERTREMMDRQVNHMVRLIDDLLDVARISSGKVELKKQRVTLRSVVDAAVETCLPLFETGGHQLEVQMPPEDLPLEVDPTRMAQVLGNLLNNAAKYTPAGGRIALSASTQDGQVAISVTDTGIGIPTEYLPELFQMFTQVGRNMNRAQGGLGIGLSLVRALVELHGGSVTASSDGAGQGSTFSVLLPLALPVAPGLAREAMTQAAEPTQSFRVLVVDDNRDAADSLAMILEMNGHKIRVANDGEQAIGVAGEFHPEVVFLDIGMPGKNGYEVARELRQTAAASQAVLVALTGWGTDGDRARSRDAGFDHHLTKPAEMAAVEQLLAQLTRPAT